MTILMQDLFNPQSIAVIGAPREKQKLGFTILKNIAKLGYNGKVYPINPKAKKILGLDCYKSVLDVQGEIDLAIIIVPAKVVPIVLKECAQKKIKSAVVISAGFKETGADGAKLEKEIAKISQENNIKLVGPNCLGIINPYFEFNASFAEGMPKKGKVGFVSQSGAVITAVLDWAGKNDFGFSKIVSIGNKAGLDESDFLEYFVQDEETEVVVLYIESVERGKHFIEMARKLSEKKPVLVLKAGRTEAGQKTALSHTGVLCGEDKMFDAVFVDSGLLRVDTLEDLFILMKIFGSEMRLPKNKIAVVTNAGGLGVMAVDALAGTGLELSVFSAKTTEKLKKGLPEAANTKNPVDVIGDADSSRYKVALEAVLADEDVGGAVVILTPQTVTEKLATAKIVADLKKKYLDKPIFTAFVGGKTIGEAVVFLQEKNILNFHCPERAVWALSMMNKYAEISDRMKKISAGRAEFLSHKNHEIIKEILLTAKVNKIKKVADKDVGKILELINLPVAKSALVASAKEAADWAAKKYPVALKTASDKIIHKSDVGAVRANIRDEAELLKAFKEIAMNARAVDRKTIQLMTVQEQVVGTELIVGMKRDAQFGPVIMFGAGGIYTEILNDTVVQVAPISKDKAMEMIKSIKSFALLKGARGKQPVKLETIAEIIVKISNLSLEFGEIKEIDINPLIANNREAKAVDVRVIV